MDLQRLPETKHLNPVVKDLSQSSCCVFDMRDRQLGIDFHNGRSLILKLIYGVMSTVRFFGKTFNQMKNLYFVKQQN